MCPADEPGLALASDAIASTARRAPAVPEALEAVVFDLGGTLIDYLGGAPKWPEMEFPGVHALHAHLTAAGLGVNVDRFRARFIAAMDRRWRSATDSLLDPPTLVALIDEMCEAMGLALDLDAREAAVMSYCQPIAERATLKDGAAELLRWLAARGVRIGLVANAVWPGDAHRRDLERFGLLRHFDATVFSSECGLWKPDPQVFAHTLGLMGARPAGTVFVGDRLLEDVQGAQRAGLRSVFVEGTPDYQDIDPNSFRPDARIQRLADLPGAL